MRQEFSTKTKLAAFDRANGMCEVCGQKIIGRAEYDHALPDFFGGKPDLDNCQCLCSKCHRLKTSTADVPRIAKTKRTKAKTVGAVRKKHKWPTRKFGARAMLRTVARQERISEEMDT